MKQICRDDHIPSEDTIYRWIDTIPVFSENYACARERQAERYAAEIVEIADTCSDPNKARLQMDARKWYASKVAPKKFGDKLDVKTEHSGSIGLSGILAEIDTARLPKDDA